MIFYGSYFFYNLKLEDQLASQLFKLKIYSDTILIKKQVPFSIYVEQEVSVDPNEYYEFSIAQYKKEQFTTIAYHTLQNIKYEENLKRIELQFNIPQTTDIADGLYLVVNATAKQKTIKKNILLTVQ